MGVSFYEKRDAFVKIFSLLAFVVPPYHDSLAKHLMPYAYKACQTRLIAFEYHYFTHVAFFFFSQLINHVRLDPSH